MTRILTWLKAKAREWSAPDYEAVQAELREMSLRGAELKQKLDESREENFQLTADLISSDSQRDTFKRGFESMQEAMLKQARELKPQWQTEFADEAPKWQAVHAEAWKAFLGQNEAGRTLQRVANFMEQQTNRSAVHRTSGTEQNVGYARGWHDATNYFFRQLSADPQPQSGTDTQATNEAGGLRERLASG